jgi:Ca2+-binding RTX toxin-like protein
MSHRENQVHLDEKDGSKAEHMVVKKKVDPDQADAPDAKQLDENEKVIPEKDDKEAKGSEDSAPDATVNITKETTAELDAKDGHTTDLSTIKIGNFSEVTSQERDLATLSAFSDTQSVYHQQTTFIEFLPTSPLNTSIELNRIQGTSGADILYGTFQPDLILGLQGNDQLFGLLGDDVLDGGPGIDKMSGGLGNDIYYVDNSSDMVIELPGEGIDTVYTSVNYTLPANVENLTSLGPAGNFTFLSGNDLNNIIRGSDGMDVINGGLGADIMIGGLGDDQYFINDIGDVIQEKVNEGVDQVYTSISYTLPQNVEVLLGLAANITLTGNDLDNIINAVQSNTTLIGGLGNDLYVVRFANDIVIENPGEGNDEIQTDVSFVLPDNVERLYGFGTSNINLTGNSGNNFITSNQGDNQMTGGLGADFFAFRVNGSGNDTVTDFNLAESDMLSFNGVTDTDGIPGLGIQDLKNMVTSVENPGGVDTKFNFAAGQSVTLVGVVVSNVDDPTIASNIQVYGF